MDDDLQKEVLTIVKKVKGNKVQEFNYQEDTITNIGNNTFLRDNESLNAFRVGDALCLCFRQSNFSGNSELEMNKTLKMFSFFYNNKSDLLEFTKKNRYFKQLNLLNKTSSVRLNTFFSRNEVFKRQLNEKFYFRYL